MPRRRAAGSARSREEAPGDDQEQVDDLGQVVRQTVIVSDGALETAKRWRLWRNNVPEFYEACVQATFEW